MIDECPYPRPTPETVQSLEGLLYFIWEREAIRLARENGYEAPWTADIVLDKYKFTNIHRSDDRVSKWIIENVIDLYEDRSDLWFTLLIVRLINWPPTITALLENEVIPCSPSEFDANLFESVLESLKETGGKVYSGAYMLYPTKMEPGGNKSRAVAKYIIGDAVLKSDDIQKTLQGDGLTIERFVNAMSRCFGISTFIAGQVAADLTYSTKHLCFADDLFEYAPIGPGSSRGLNYLFNRAPSAGWTQEEFNLKLRQIFKLILDHLEIDDMTLHDVQNCMCEYSKYCRTVLNEGKPKTQYKPETEF